MVTEYVMLIELGILKYNSTSFQQFELWNGQAYLKPEMYIISGELNLSFHLLPPGRLTIRFGYHYFFLVSLALH
jgi:hypothetical protein